MKKGFSLIGMLLAVLIIGLMAKLMLQQYRKALVQTNPNQQTTHIQTPAQAQKTLQNVRATLHQVEKSAQRRADYGQGF
ncbi:MAG: hypothetical protein J5601_02045 [Elusimicrobiaceae bacterium]|nr:hypothetical protein [Elusimicrobiaceae bacterium]